MFALNPLKVIEQRVVLGEGDIGSCAAPVRGGVRSAPGDDREGKLSRPRGQARDALGSCRIWRKLIGIERRAVIAGVAVFELINKVRREDVNFFNHTYSGLGSIRLTVVVRDV